MLKSKTTLGNISIAFLSILVLFQFMVIAVDADLINVLKYLFYIVTYLFIPGFTFISLINKRINNCVFHQNIIFSFVFGLIIEIIIFIISSAIIHSFLLLRIYPALFVVILLIDKTEIYKLKKQLLQISQISILQALFIWSIVFLFSWLNICHPISKPIMESPIYIDLIWGLGIVKEFINNFPWYNPHNYSGVFKYHYFVFIHNAASVINSTAPADVVYLKLNGIFVNSVIFFLIYRISSLIFSRWFISIIPVCFIAFIPGIFPLISIYTYTYLVLSPTYAFSYVFFLGIIYIAIINKEVKISHALIYTLLFFGAMGSKGSSAVILIGAFFITFLSSFIRREKWKGPLIITGILVFAFILQYLIQYYPHKRAEGLLLNTNIDPFLLLKSIAYQLMDVRIVSLLIFSFALIRINNLRILVNFSISALIWIFLIFQYEPPAVWDKFYFYSYAAIPLTILFIYILFENVNTKHNLRYLRFLLFGLFSILILLSVRNIIYRLNEEINTNSVTPNQSSAFSLTDPEIDIIKFLSNIKGNYNYFFLDNKNYNKFPTNTPGVDRKYLDLCYRITAYGELRRISPKDMIKNEIELQDTLIQHKDKNCVILFSDVKSVLDSEILFHDVENIYENENFIVFSTKEHLE